MNFIVISCEAGGIEHKNQDFIQDFLHCTAGGRYFEIQSKLWVEVVKIHCKTTTKVILGKNITKIFAVYWMISIGEKPWDQYVG